MKENEILKNMNNQSINLIQQGINKQYELRQLCEEQRSIIEELKETEPEQKMDMVSEEAMNYKSWESQDIVNLDKDRYSKYCYKLLNNMNEEGIDGMKFVNLTVNDLHRLGIIGFKDKRELFECIQHLKQ